MQSMSYFGIDASGAELVVAASDQRHAPLTIANRAAAIGQWLDTLPAHAVIGIESTGSCHAALVGAACARGLRVYLLNALDVRHYARSLGRRGKTDRVDAEVIARYVAQEHSQLHAYTPPAPDLATLEALLRRRALCVQCRAQIAQSLDPLPDVTAAAAALRAEFDHFITAIDDAITQRISADLDRRTRWQRLMTIPGVGPLVAAMLVSLFERVPFHRAQAVVAFTGLDPRPCDSGPKRARRRLRTRGPPEVRRLLYLAAMAFARTLVGRTHLDHHRAKQLSSTAVYVILARKLIRIAWSINRSGKPFDPQCLAAA